MEGLQIMSSRRPSKCSKGPGQNHAAVAGETSVRPQSVSPRGDLDQTEISIFTIRNRQSVSPSTPPRNSTPVEIPVAPTTRSRMGSKIKSPLSTYLELMYNIGICPHAENERTLGWKRIHDVKTFPQVIILNFLKHGSFRMF